MSLTIVFNNSKNELFKLTGNYRIVHRLLKPIGRIETNKSEISPEVLAGISVFVLAGSQQRFTEAEFNHLRNFVTKGGSLLVLLGEGGEVDFNTNINFILEEFGMSFNSDHCVRLHYAKSFHPKETTVSAAIHLEGLQKDDTSTPILKFIDSTSTSDFNYPYGSSMNVVNPSKVILKTGHVTYPFHRPVGGVFVGESQGKILAIGSGHMFSDKYIVSGNNTKLLTSIFSFLLSQEELQFDPSSDSDVNDYNLIQDTIYLAEVAKLCMVESLDCEVPEDFKKMFDTTLYSLNNNLLRDVIGAYQKLDVKYEALKIIKPQFELPLPPLKLAVFRPIFCDLPHVPIELFDLDEWFSTEKSQISHQTKKCLALADSRKSNKPDVKEIEDFIQRCGSILRVSREGGPQQSAKSIMYTICTRIANYKKLSKE